MSIKTKSADVLLWFYKNINKMGLLDSKIARSLYVSAYFTYKKYLEDSYARLTKYHPHFFNHGNVLDIGANIGYTSFVFSKIIKPPYKILAFEPELRNLELLEQVSQKYHFNNKLISVAAAVGNEVGEMELWRNEVHNGDHRILTDTLRKQLKGQLKIQKTPVITIDSYLEKFGSDFPVSFIKIDVQGYELAVCHGMVDTLIRNENAIISFEYCPSVIESLGFIPEDLLHFFKERHYQFYILNRYNNIEKYNIENGNRYLRQIKSHDYIDILCARRELGN